MATVLLFLALSIPCLAQDADSDGILDDGDGSTIVGDNPCADGVTTNCDDNCVNDANPGQEDLDGDLIGDVCDGGVPGTLVNFAATLSTPRTFLNLTVTTGGTLTADALVTVTGDMTVESGGLVTHSPYSGGAIPSMVLTVTGTLDVQSGGSLD
ncbi:MAG: hypothetical protein GTN89_04640, partial [Acidobacteria bacterium]|nr:hypothetical protein [Acidobacteriota bacterium]NIO58607.1 hypothetical protein [Acidobacteriota bacterium]NIQ29659.1 hypothetical protein [Acidobacteriota bacterium]NIQ84376.1 hypothetical protein [Acidobacteriota bacterium]NIT10325.1 hypothetical protein [Acidobacteriota bacterium]